MERMPIPFAVFQLVDNRIVTLVLSDGFCELLGEGDRDSACAAMDRDTFHNVHPDDAARVGEAVYRFVRDGGELDIIYRLQAREGSGYIVLHALRLAFTGSYGGHFTTAQCLWMPFLITAICLGIFYPLRRYFPGLMKHVAMAK